MKHMMERRKSVILKKEDRKKLLSFLVSGFGIGILFYDSIAAGLVAVFLFLIWDKRQKKKGKIEDAKESEFKIQLKDAFQSISASLEAGYSVENAWREARKELLLLYPEEAEIVQEFTRMEHQLNNHISMEEILKEFAEKRRIEAVESFTAVFLTAKRTGGDIIKIVSMASETIRMQLETAQEIDTMLSGKKYEAKFMKIVPSVLILYFRFCSPGYLDIFYHSYLGVLCMTIVLIINFMAAAWAERIASIQL